MASAATLLKEKGYDVVWLDGVAEKWTQEQFLEKLKKEKPDLIVFEVKTPVIKKYWQLINQLKKLQAPGFKPQQFYLAIMLPPFLKNQWKIQKLILFSPVVITILLF